jgi:hypothetical protein
MMSMQNDPILDAVLRTTFTTSDFYRRIDMLRELLEHHLFENNARQASAAEIIGWYRGRDIADADRDAVAAWGDEVFGTLNAGNLHERIEALKQEVEKLPRLVLYVPVPLDMRHVENIGAWCREHISPQVMLETHVDPSSTGGCSYVYNDVFRDFSFSYFVSKRRNELVKLLHAYG